jgi:hypothetical protein
LIFLPKPIILYRESHREEVTNMAGRPPTGKVSVEKALAVIFGRGGRPKVGAVVKELIRTNGWSPTPRVLYIYATKWNSGNFVSQGGKKPRPKLKLDLRDMIEPGS